MSKDRKTMRYAARLTCIWDWTQGETDRIPERFSKGDCLEAISRLAKTTDPEALNLWSAACEDLSGIGNKDITEAVHWDLNELVRVYDMQRREIEAVQVLKSLYEKDGRTLFPIANEIGIYPWTLQSWMDMRKRVSWYVVLASEELKDCTIIELFKRAKELQSNYYEERKK